MLLLIEIDNDESYEDYQSWVEYVFDVETDKNHHVLSVEYNSFICDKLLNEYKITVHPFYTYQIEKKGKITAKERKLVLDIHKNNSFMNWLQDNYKCNQLKFETYHQY